MKNKKTKKQILLEALATISITVVPLATIISCGKNKSTIPKDDTLMEKYTKEILKHDDDSNKIIDSKAVNLVALGDSVASGYTLLEGMMSDKHRGHYDPKTKKVSGISYSSYIARAFQKQKALNDFDNFAIAGATTSTLAKQIDSEFKLSEKEKGTQQQLDMLVSSEEKERFKTLHNKLKKADLITLSIGANDILGQITIGGKSIYELLIDPTSLSFKGDLNKFIDFGSEEEMNKIIQDARINLIQTIAKIKEINPHTKIVLVGYPMPVNQLAPILKLMKADRGGKTIEVANELLKKLSSISTEISKRFKTIDYVDAYSTSEWDQKSIELTPELFDIHPGPKGYREMAATIIANLSGQDVSKGPLKSNISNKGDIEKRLSKNYEETILKYQEKDKDGKYKPTQLEPEAQSVQDKAKPTKLIKFVAKVIDSISDGLLKPSQQNSYTLNNKDSYTSKNINVNEVLELVEHIKPFVKSIFVSANAGYKSSDAKVKEAVDQDLKYIFSRLITSMMEKIKSLDKKTKKIVGTMIGIKPTTGTLEKILNTFFGEAKAFLDSNETQEMKTFKEWLIKNQDDEKVMKESLKKGISSFDYTK